MVMMSIVCIVHLGAAAADVKICLQIPHRQRYTACNLISNGLFFLINK